MTRNDSRNSATAKPDCATTSSSGMKTNSSPNARHPAGPSLEPHPTSAKASPRFDIYRTAGPISDEHFAALLNIDSLPSAKGTNAINSPNAYHPARQSSESRPAPVKAPPRFDIYRAAGPISDEQFAALLKIEDFPSAKGQVIKSAEKNGKRMSML